MFNQSNNFLIREIKLIFFLNRANIAILTAMLSKACHSQNFPFILSILDLIKENSLKLDEAFVKTIYRFKYSLTEDAKQGYNEKEDRRKSRNEIKNFKLKLNDWMNEMGLRGLPFKEAIKKFQVHPYKQFKEPAETSGFEPEKNSRIREFKKKKGVLRKDFD